MKSHGAAVFQRITAHGGWWMLALILGWVGVSGNGGVRTSRPSTLRNAADSEPTGLTSTQFRVVPIIPTSLTIPSRSTSFPARYITPTPSSPTVRLSIDPLPTSTFSSSRSLKLQGRVSVSTAVLLSDIMFHWSSDMIDLSLPSNVLTSGNNLALKLHKDVLHPSRQYLFTFTAQWGALIASSSIIVRTSSKPVPGKLKVTPAIGTELSTMFNVIAIGWTINPTRLCYIFSYSVSNGTELAINGGECSSSTSIQLILPAGDSTNSYKVTIWVRAALEQSISIPVGAGIICRPASTQSATLASLTGLMESTRQLTNNDIQLAALILNRLALANRESKQAEQIRSSLISFLSSTVVSVNNSAALNAVATSLQLLTSHLTSNSTAIVIHLAREIISKSLTSSGSSLLSNVGHNAIAQTASSVIDSMGNSTRRGKAVINLIASIAQSQLQSIATCEQSPSINTNNFIISSWKVDQVSRSTCPITSVTLPSTLPAIATGQTIGITTTSWTSNPNDDTSQTIVSKVQSVNMYMVDAVSGDSTLLDVSNLQSPVMIQLPLRTPSASSTGDPADDPQCVSFNTTSGNWSTLGCIANTRTATFITCGCIHLTDFALVIISSIERDGNADGANLLKRMSTILIFFYFAFLFELIYAIRMFIQVKRHIKRQMARRTLQLSLTLTTIVTTTRCVNAFVSVRLIDVAMSPAGLLLFAVVPVVFQFALFTFFVAVLAATAERIEVLATSKESGMLHRFRLPFLIANFIISIIVPTVLIVGAFLRSLALLYISSVAIAVICIITGMAVMSTGHRMRVMFKYASENVSVYNPEQGAMYRAISEFTCRVTLAFSVMISLQGLVWLLSIVNFAAYKTHYELYETIYLLSDATCVGLCLAYNTHSVNFAQLQQEARDKQRARLRRLRQRLEESHSPVGNNDVNIALAGVLLSGGITEDLLANAFMTATMKNILNARGKIETKEEEENLNERASNDVISGRNTDILLANTGLPPTMLNLTPSQEGEEEMNTVLAVAPPYQVKDAKSMTLQTHSVVVAATDPLSRICVLTPGQVTELVRLVRHRLRVNDEWMASPKSKSREETASCVTFIVRNVASLLTQLGTNEDAHVHDGAIDDMIRQVLNDDKAPKAVN